MATFIGRKSAVNSVYNTKNITEDSVWWLVHTVWTQCHICWMSFFHWSNNTVSQLLNVWFPLIKQKCHVCWMSCFHWSNSVTSVEWVVSTNQTTVSQLLNEWFPLIKQQCHVCWMSCFHCTSKCHNCLMSGSPWWNNTVSHLFHEQFPLFKQHSITFHKIEPSTTPMWEPRISQCTQVLLSLCTLWGHTGSRGTAPQILYLDTIQS